MPIFQNQQLNQYLLIYSDMQNISRCTINSQGGVLDLKSPDPKVNVSSNFNNKTNSYQNGYHVNQNYGQNSQPHINYHLQDTTQNKYQYQNQSQSQNHHNKLQNQSHNQNQIQIQIQNQYLNKNQTHSQNHTQNNQSYQIHRHPQNQPSHNQILSQNQLNSQPAHTQLSSQTFQSNIQQRQNQNNKILDKNQPKIPQKTSNNKQLTRQQLTQIEYTQLKYTHDLLEQYWKKHRQNNIKKQSDSKLHDDQIDLNYYLCDSYPKQLKWDRYNDQFNQKKQRQKLPIVITKLEGAHEQQIPKKIIIGEKTNKYNCWQQQQNSLYTQSPYHFPKQQLFFYTLIIKYEDDPQIHLKNGQFRIFEDPTFQMLKQAILRDINKQNKLYLKHPILKQKHAIFMKKERFYHKILNKIKKKFGYQQNPSKQGVLFTYQVKDRKIDLSADYQLINPKQFIGYTLQLNNLSIGNSFGKVTWKCSESITIDTTIIKFQQAIHIKQRTFQIDCPILEQGQLIIQFYYLYFQTNNSKWSTKKIQKRLRKRTGQQNCQFLWYDPQTKHWAISTQFQINL